MLYMLAKSRYLNRVNCCCIGIFSFIQILVFHKIGSIWLDCPAHLKIGVPRSRKSEARSTITGNSVSSSSICLEKKWEYVHCTWNMECTPYIPYVHCQIQTLLIIKVYKFTLSLCQSDRMYRSQSAKACDTFGSPAQRTWSHLWWMMMMVMMMMIYI